MRTLHVAVAVAFLMVGGSRPAAQDKKQDDAVSAEELTKVYDKGAAEFDKAYKGKAIIVEGIVSLSGAKAGAKSYLMIDGFRKPGESYVHRMRCEETADFEGIRAGHKVRISGTVQGHSEISVAELRDCKVVKVFADDFPPSKEVKAEVKKLQGKWKILSHEANGKKLAGAEAPFTAVEFDGYIVLLHQGKQYLQFGLKLDLAKTPKQMDLVGGRTLPSIYLLDGDKMQLFLPAVTKDGKGFVRAGNFDTAESAGILLKIERQK
jgi:uncharacterized protein (TIGR03067 family)